MANLSLKLEQKTKLMQVQRLTIQLLALHGQELMDFLQEQVTDNPLLDIRYHDVRGAGDKNEKPIDNIKSRSASLESQLMAQLRVVSVPRPILLAAGLVIGSLDEKGFFQGDLSSLGDGYGLSEEDLEKGLELVQTFDPPGIGARNICEALLIQTRRRSDGPPKTEELLTRHYDDFLRGKWSKIQQGLELSDKDLRDIRDFLKTLSLQPAGQIEQDEVYIRPDVEIYLDEGGTLVFRWLEELPDVYFRDDLYAEYGAQKDKKTLAYIRKSRRAFNDLASALAYRRLSIEQVMTCLLTRQEGYFLHGQPLEPLRQKDIAEETGLSTATVSRVCRNRYALFDGKVYGLQSFLATAYSRQREDEDFVSDKAIMKKIQALIANEDKEHPYSDQDVADYFSAIHITIARRTITKFRQKLNIPNSNIRRRCR